MKLATLLGGWGAEAGVGGLANLLTGFGLSAIAIGPDQETAQAVLVAWNSATLTLTPLIPGGIHKDKLVKPTATNQFSSGSRYIDDRLVTISIWGVGDVATGTIVPAVQNVLDDRPLTFTSPFVVGWMRTEPLDVTCTEVDDTKAGQEYRAAVFRWCVWTDRKQPGR